jgi:hypothetical protein
MGGVQIAAVLLALLFLPATAAHADWIVAALAGASHTNTNTLTVGGPVSASIGNVEYRGEGFKSPIYYDVRFGRAPIRGFGVEGEWIHAKARATTGSDTLSKFDQSHGLNFVLGSLVYRHPVTDRVLLSARGGGGFTLPHVEGTLLGTHTEAYQYGGLAVHGGAGVEVRIAGGLTALADLRITRTAEELEVAGATVSGTFVTSHVDFGIGWRF